MLHSCVAYYNIAGLLAPVADPVGFDEVRLNPHFLVRWRPFTTSLELLIKGVSECCLATKNFKFLLSSVLLFRLLTLSAHA